METAADLNRLGITLRPLPSGMSRSGNNRRRDLTYEGRALLQYVLKTKPSFNLVRRYVRCIEQLRGGGIVEVPWLLLSNPHLIALIDQPGKSASKGDEEFAWRLNAVMVLAEASTKGAIRFLNAGNSLVFCEWFIPVWCLSNGNILENCSDNFQTILP